MSSSKVCEAFFPVPAGLDPLAFGCYSGYLPGFDDDSYSVLGKPVKDEHGTDRLFLAGEAMC